MTITVRYFASLKEYTGRASDLVEFEDGFSVQDIWGLANQNLALPDNVLSAVNMEYVSLTDFVNDGDEVAFFPPVTGG